MAGSTPRRPPLSRARRCGRTPARTSCQRPLPSVSVAFWPAALGLRTTGCSAGATLSSDRRDTLDGDCAALTLGGRQAVRREPVGVSRFTVLMCTASILTTLACSGDDDAGAGAAAGTGGVGGAAGAAGDGGSGGAGGEEPSVTCGECEASGAARCWFVALDGDDDGDGSFEAPFRTIVKGVSSAQPGDFVYLRAGVWGREAERTATSCGDSRNRFTIVPLGDVDVYGVDEYGDLCSEKWPSFEVASGTAEAPITIAACPGEEVVLDGEPDKFLDPSEVIDDSHEGWPESAPRANPIQVVSAWRDIAYWTVRGFEIRGGIVNINGWGNGDSGPELEANPHHITIADNEIHDVMTWGGGNPGMVRINRGDWYGPYEIHVRGNHIHHMRDNDDADWSETSDAQHYGAVTTLSAETYLGVDRGGTGRVVIEDNVIHAIPHAFFFKNPAAGPIEIRRNRIYDVQAVGIDSSSNLTFEHNLVRTRRGFVRVGADVAGAEPGLYELAGQNAVVRYNTFVDLHLMLSCRSGTGHTIEHNVVYGLWGQTAGANWDTPAVIAKSEVYHDELAPQDSLLQQITMDHNCYVGPHADFQHTSRYLPPEVTGADWIVEHHDLAAAQTTFGFDLNAVTVVTDEPSDLFVDYDGGDFTIRSESPCAGEGADLTQLPAVP